jgi:hypothetical protein
MESLVLQAKEHWRQYRPKMYAALEASGQLDQMAREAAQRHEDALYALIQKGLKFHEAEALVREDFVFLPSEEDQPELGAAPEADASDE